MILIENAYFKTSEDADQAIQIKDGLYLFLIVSLSGRGTANIRAAWSHTKDTAAQGEQFIIPDQRAQDLEGGAGSLRYNQIIDRVETIVINYLSAFNTGCTFTKIP